MSATESGDNLLKSPLIVVGPGRSGTTIISEIVFAHEDLAWPSNYLDRASGVVAAELLRRIFDNRWWHFSGEKKQLNKRSLLNALFPRPAEAYVFWNRISRSDIDFSRSFLLDERATPEEADHIRKAVSQIVTLQGRKRFAMKITGPGRISYLNSLFPDAIFVNVVRDVYAIVSSLLRIPFWEARGKHMLWWTGAYTNSELAYFSNIQADPTAVTAFQVAKVMKTTLAEGQRLNIPMFTVRYEDFVNAPERTIDDITKFADLPVSEQVERKLANTRIHDQNKHHRLSVEQRKTVDSVFRHVSDNWLQPGDFRTP